MFNAKHRISSYNNIIMNNNEPNSILEGFSSKLTTMRSLEEYFPEKEINILSKIMFIINAATS